MSRNRSSPLRAARRAVARVRAFGLDGPRPIEEIEALLEHDADVEAALEAVLEEAGAEDLPAAIHLVSLLRREAALPTVRRLAFETPASIEAKREALEALRACGAEPDPALAGRVEAVEQVGRRPDAQALDDLLGWPPAWRQPALDLWIGAAGSEQIAAAEAALGRDGEADERLLDWLGSQATGEAAEALQRYLRAADDKQRIKQARRALHRLRSQGLDVEAPGEPAAAAGFTLAIDSDPLEGARAYLTSIDGRGARLVWVLWRAASGGSRLLQAVVDDSVGVREAEIATVTRNGFREYIGQVDANPTILLAQVEPSLAIEALQAAARRSEESGNKVPAAYPEFARRAHVSAGGAGAATARIYELIDAGELGGDAALIEASMTLLREPYFQSWAMEGAAVDAAAEEVHSAETSTLMISEEQRRERMQAAIRNAVHESFNPDTRSLYRGRLEEMATMLWERGRHDEARRALAAAIGLTDVEDLFHGHAFARALVHRGVWLAYQDHQRAAAAEQQRSRLVQP